MFPFMRGSPTYTLNIPEMSGGINLRDGLTLINDNQLTDVKNMWFKDGCLKTRPRIQTNADTSKLHIYEHTRFDRVHSFEAKSYPEFILVYNNQTYTLQVVSKVVEDVGNGGYTHSFVLRYISDNYNIIPLGEIKGFSEISQAHCLVFQHNGDVYLFTTLGDGLNYWVIKHKEQYGTITFESPLKLTEEDMTAPLVAINCLPTNQVAFIGSMVNGYNLIGAYFKVEYSSVNPDVTDPWFWEEDDEKKTLHKLVYYSPWVTNIPYSEMKDYAGLKVTAELTNKDGETVVHEAVIGDNGLGREESGSEDGLVIEVTPVSVKFFVDDGTWATEARAIEGDVQIRNNLTITFPALKPYGGEKVANMTRATWFGGYAEGIYGGSRLFLCGNVDDNEGALVVWSDLNDPLYFSENNYTYVGDKSQDVTVFGKQSDTLVIFKTHEMYQTQYVANDLPSATDVINQSVIDLSAQTVTFPMTLVHGYIGCDCPDTVQLCRNRLVWTNSNGKVYSLVSQNQYNERAVLEVGEMITPKLKTEENLRKAHSVDFEGYYIIQTNNKMYVMDYNSYGFIYAASHAKNEDANIKIPWYYWEFPLIIDGIYGTVDNLMITYSDYYREVDEPLRGAINIGYIDGSVGIDEINQLVYNNGWTTQLNFEKVKSYMQTKLYNFGMPSRLKSVPMVNLSLGYNNSEPINVEFISERNIPDQHTIIVDGVESNEREPEHIHSCRLFPYTKGTVMFGIKIGCDSNMSIAAVTLQYKQLGGAK